MTAWWPRPEAAALGRVVVIYGGRSAEREVSLRSGQGVLEALRSAGVSAQGFDPGRQPLQALIQGGYDRAFVALHGRWGEDGAIQGVLEWLGLPYTGAGIMASALAMDKDMTKRLWQHHGLPTPAWCRATSPADVRQALHDLGAPLIVKPSREGSTLGLTRVQHVEQAEAAYQAAAQLDPAVLCERCIVGDEVTVPVFGQGQALHTMPIIRIVAPNGNYDYHAKYLAHTTQYLIPSGLPLAQEQAIEALAKQAYAALGVRGWGRIDFMIDGRTRAPYLLELNTSPGMTDHSLVPQSAQHLGLSYAQLCMGLLAQASLDNPPVALPPAAA